MEFNSFSKNEDKEKHKNIQYLSCKYPGIDIILPSEEISK
jgi:hypothetical protein